MTTKSQTDNTELRKSIHMAMLAKSESAKDCGEITVVPLGFAVDVALQAVQAKLKEAYQQGYDDRTLEADHELEQQDITSRIDELENIVKKAEIKGASFTFEYKYFADRLTELRSKL